MKINVFATGENCIALDNYLRFIISTSVQSSWLNCCSNGFAGTNYASPFDWSMIKFVDWRHVMMKDCVPRLDFVLFLLANGNWIEWENFRELPSNWNDPLEVKDFCINVKVAFEMCGGWIWQCELDGAWFWDFTELWGLKGSELSLTV